MQKSIQSLILTVFFVIFLISFVGCDSLLKTDLLPPAEVTDLTANAGNKEVTLTWIDPIDTDLTEIIVTYSINSFKKTAIVLAGVGTYTIKDLTNDAQYLFKVQTGDKSANISVGKTLYATPSSSVTTTSTTVISTTTTTIVTTTSSTSTSTSTSTTSTTSTTIPTTTTTTIVTTTTTIPTTTTTINGDKTKPYTVNPTLGKYISSSTIAIDGSIGANEWTDDMLITINMAGDDPRTLGSNWSMHECPFDVTHMWAAWDDSNIYVAWQYVDITDIADPSNAGSSAGTKPSQQNTPTWLAFDTVSGQGASVDMWKKNLGKPYWTGVDLPDYQMYIAGNFWQAYISKAVSNVFVGDPVGANYYKFVQNPAQGTTVGTPVGTSGINIAFKNGLAASTLWGVKDADDRNTPSKMVDFKALGHDGARDTFYEMKIPFTVLGITKSDLETKGIGIMLGQGEGSCLDTVPRDDAALTDSTGVTDSNSPKEWGDSDSFTVPFARIGHAK
ncbi:MAG: hypothetical protein A2086_12550 [Spirochaetes bacterium GWD1_27_9]|nr:MAG: hypothetical protein A2Z98_10905 [Spirochaetes bacterium GWB1_27_13]OHD28192.1 MAG: hypothetical protein A2Y34_07290 [Spirochaetes bacterium GWC1_27_15]OHD44289.1 MAG: hypothetical protein A2086_12550 [Spirochaetes bacterium GWD1_27_9]